MKRIEKTCLSVLLALVLIPICAQQDPSRLNWTIGLPLLTAKRQWLRPELQQVLLRSGISLQGTRTRMSAFLRGRKIFSIPATEILLISDQDDIVTQVDIIFSDKGDKPNRMGAVGIKAAGKSLKTVLTDSLGNPVKGKFGLKGFQQDVLIWKYGTVRFLLETVRKEYTILHICYSGESEKGFDKKDLQQFQRKDFSDNIQTNGFGDVYIDNIPMANQGDKGYCVPATLERVLRYYGISQVSMHQLAAAFETKGKRGTSFSNMVQAIQHMDSGLDIHPCEEIELKTLKKFIDQGIPVLWGMYINRSLMELMRTSRARRPKAKTPGQWLKSIQQYNLPRGGRRHMCLIVGYNARTGEIAISNSWGDRESIPAWIPLKLAFRISQKTSFVLIPSEKKQSMTAEIERNEEKKGKKKIRQR